MEQSNQQQPANESFAQWDRRCKAEMRRHRVNLDAMFEQFWDELGMLRGLDGYFPEMRATMEFITRWLWEPSLTDEEWHARLWAECLEVDIQPWREHALRGLTQFWLGLDGDGNPQRYFPHDRTRPADCAYVCVRGEVHISYPLGDQPPAGEGWRPMTGWARLKWQGRLGWWRYPRHE